MIEDVIVITGKITDFVQTKSSNRAFHIRDKQNNTHYCFITKSKNIGSPSDTVSVVGKVLSSGKIRVNYVYNFTESKEIVIQTKPSSTFYNLLRGLSVLFIVLFLISLVNLLVFSYTYIFSFFTLIPVSVILIIVLIMTYIYHRSYKRQKEFFEKVQELSSKIDKTLTYHSQKRSDLRDNDSDSYESSYKYCPYCGDQILKNAKYCTNCGNELLK